MRILPVGASVLLALSVAISGATAATKPTAKKAAAPESAFTTANSLAGHAKYKEAVEKYKEALSKDPNNPAVHHYYGRTLALMGLIPDAIDQYDVALKLEKRPNAELENDIGVALATNDDKVEAAKHLHKATQLNPKYIAAFNNLGVALMRLGDYLAARDAFLTSLKMQPTNPYIQKKLKDVTERLSESKHFDYNAKPEPTAAAKPAEPEGKPATANGAQRNSIETKASVPASESVKESTAGGAERPVAPSAVAAAKTVQKKPVAQPEITERATVKKPLEHAPVEAKQPAEHVSVGAKKPVEHAPAEATRHAESSMPSSSETTALTPKHTAQPAEAAPASVAAPVSVFSGQTPTGGGTPPVAGVSTSLDGVGEITTRKVPLNKTETSSGTANGSGAASGSTTSTTSPNPSQTSTAASAPPTGSVTNGSGGSSDPATETTLQAKPDPESKPAPDATQPAASAPNGIENGGSAGPSPAAGGANTDTNTDAKQAAPTRTEKDSLDQDDSEMSGDKKAE